jgi:subtilase family serine protease
MHKPGARLACTALLLIFAIFAAPGSTQVSSRDRISRPVDAAQTALVKGTAHPLARAQFDQGRTDPSQALHGVSLTFRLSPAQQADLDNLLRQQQDPSSPNYHKWLTPEQYAARFGMTQNDLAKVTSWLQSQGLTVDGISRNRTEVSFSGTVGQIEYALKTEIHNYSINGERHFANATDVALPAAFASEVLGVRNLNDFRPKPRFRKASPRFTSSISGNHFIIPGDFATIYDLNPLYTLGLDGAGQTIAVVGQTAISLTDIDGFRSAAGLSKYDPTLFLVPNTGTSQTFASDLGEADLDVEWSGGVAKNAAIIYVYVGNSSTKSVFDALQYAIINDVAPVISISYGNCEANLPSGFPLTMQQWAQQANAQGQTISAPAGDEGAADCESVSATSAIHGLAVDAPASIPEVTGVGGTEFTGDASQCPIDPNTGKHTCPVTPACPNGSAPADPPYWAATCNLNSGTTALPTTFLETAWNDTAQSLALTPPGGFAASGGGASTIFTTKPIWQTGPGVPSDGKRDVPDISLNASNFHDPYLICSGGSCTNGFRDSSNNLTPVGGTSVGAPSFAGILAIINQATQSSKGQGNANPNLYSLAVSTPSAFHDVPTGSNNNVPCTKGSTGCPNGGTIGFSTGPNYDQVTGLGSIDAFNLVHAWPGFTSAQAFSVGASPLAMRIAAVGQSGSTPVIVGGTNGFTGSVALSCSVPSTATSKISCAITPSSVSLDSTTTNAMATLTVNSLAASGAVNYRRLEFLAATLLVPGFLLFRLPLRKRKKFLGVLVLCVLGVAPGCGGGSSSSTQPPPPLATYLVTVTGTSGSTSHSLNVNVTAP